MRSQGRVKKAIPAKEAMERPITAKILRRKPRREIRRGTRVKASKREAKRLKVMVSPTPP